MLKKQNTEQLFDQSHTKEFKIAIVKTDYHEELVSSLEQYAITTLIKNGVEKNNIKTFSVPGSWEIPLAVQIAAESKKFDAIIAFGVIVKGETYHFEMIANESAHALMQLSIDYGIPVALEILAVFDKKQAEERSSDNDDNKGIEAAEAVLKTLLELKRIKNT